MSMKNRPLKDYLSEGIIAAPFTPFSHDGELNLVELPAYANRLQSDGVAGAFICGPTGEGSSLTTSERQRVTEAWCANRSGNFKIIVHVGQNAGRESAALAKHAQGCGADAIATLAPSFFRPASIDDLIEWCAPIAAAAPELPFYYYHMPAMAGSDFPMAEFLGRAAARIPTFVGIKFTHENLMDFGQTLIAAKDRYALLAGRDEILLSFLALGARGAVGSTYNYATPIYRRMIAAFDHNDLDAARNWQTCARAFIEVMSKSGGLAANKAMMQLATGIDCGPVRRPLRPMSRDAINTLRNSLELAGFFADLERARAAELVSAI